MADISSYLAAILSAVYGEEVRGSIHDAIKIINDVSEVVLTTGTDVTSSSSSSEGYFVDSLYLNTDTYELWKCMGVDVWQSQGSLKGQNGNGIVSIDKTGSAGLIDTYTITYDNGDTDTFFITNGEDGNRWYRGTGISGKAQNPTVYSGSGVADANVNDFYLNPSEGAVYHCVTGGAPAVATWSYDFTMTGGGGGTSDYADLANKPQINNNTLSGNQTSAQLGLMGTGSVAWLQLQPSTGATKIATITIEGTTYDVYAPTGGGGGASSLDDLSDVSIDTQTLDDGQILAYNLTDQEFQNVDMPTGGHTMISNSGYESTMATHALDDTDDDVASAYVIANWSNCDAKVVLTTVAQDADGVGDWNDTWLTDNDRTGWLWSKEFYRILEDGNGNTVTDIEVLPVFDGGKSETVSLYAYRIDDDVTVNGVNGGAVAFKLNGAIKTAGGLKIGLKLVHQRTNVSDGTIIT